MEASSYNAFYIATQGFIFTTLALYFNASPLYISIMTSFPIIAQMFQIFTPKVNNMIGSRKKRDGRKRFCIEEFVPCSSNINFS